MLRLKKFGINRYYVQKNAKRVEQAIRYYIRFTQLTSESYNLIQCHYKNVVKKSGSKKEMILANYAKDLLSILGGIVKSNLSCIIPNRTDDPIWISQ